MAVKIVRHLLPRYIFSFDGMSFETTESSKHSHRLVYGLANYKGKALTTGCNDPGDQPSCLKKTELMDMSTFKWSDGPDLFNQFRMDLNFNGVFAYSTISTVDAIYIIGGYRPISHIIVEFKNGRWNRMRNLNRPRDSHGSISVDGLTMIIGGNSCVGHGHGCGP